MDDEENDDDLNDLNGLVGGIKLIAKGGLKYEDVMNEIEFLKKIDISRNLKIREESNVVRPSRDIGYINISIF